MYHIEVPSYTFTRPSDTTAYASGDLVANSTTAASVVPISWISGTTPPQGAFIRRIRLTKSGTSTTNASFRVHIYNSSPTIANGDNGVWSTTMSGYRGHVDVTMDKAFTDGAGGIGVPGAGSELNVSAATSGTIYALIEARAAYTPSSAETFTAIPEMHVLN